MKTSHRYAAAVVGAALITSLALAVPAFAQTSSTGNPPAPQGSGSGHWQGQGSGMPGGMGRGMMMHGTPPAAFGQVTAISGTTLTITGRSFGKNAATTTYTVDATNSTVVKNNATSTISAIAVGDFVVVQGTTSGTNITATSIRDGVMMRGGPNGMKGPPGTSSGSGSAPAIQGNGQPVVAGTISAISGTTLTVTNKSNVTYTVDASDAKIVQGQSTISISGVMTGDSVIIQGAVNGTSVTASSIIDQKAPAAGTSGTPAAHGGFFGAIGQFFSHLFGF